METPSNITPFRPAPLMPETALNPFEEALRAVDQIQPGPALIALSRRDHMTNVATMLATSLSQIGLVIAALAAVGETKSVPALRDLIVIGQKVAYDIEAAGNPGTDPFQPRTA